MPDFNSIEAKEKIDGLNKELSEIDKTIEMKEKEIREAMKTKIEQMKKSYESKRSKLEKEISNLEKIISKANEKAAFEIATLAEKNPDVFSSLSSETVEYLKKLIPADEKNKEAKNECKN